METNDDTLKIRLPSELKRRLKQVVEADPDVEDLSKWIRRELRVSERIARQKRKTDDDCTPTAA